MTKYSTSCSFTFCFQIFTMVLIQKYFWFCLSKVFKFFKFFKNYNIIFIWFEHLILYRNHIRLIKKLSTYLILWLNIRFLKTVIQWLLQRLSLYFNRAVLNWNFLLNQRLKFYVLICVKIRSNAFLTV